MKTLRQVQYQYNKRLKKQYAKTNKTISYEQYKQKMKNEVILQKAIKEEQTKAKRKGYYSDKNKWQYEKKARTRFNKGGDLATKKARESYFKKKQRSILSPTNRKRAEERVLFSSNTTLMSESDVLKHKIIDRQMNRDSRKEFNKFLKENKVTMKDITLKKLDKEDIKDISGLTKNEYQVLDKNNNILGSFRYRDSHENNAFDDRKYIIDEEGEEIYDVNDEIDDVLNEDVDELEEEGGENYKNGLKNKLVFGQYKSDNAFTNKVRLKANEQFS